jgi:hypothetical protein
MTRRFSQDTLNIAKVRSHLPKSLASLPKVDSTQIFATFDDLQQLVAVLCYAHFLRRLRKSAADDDRVNFDDFRQGALLCFYSPPPTMRNEAPTEICAGLFDRVEEIEDSLPNNNPERPRKQDNKAFWKRNFVFSGRSVWKSSQNA